MRLSSNIFLLLISLQILFCDNLFADNIKIIEQPKSVTECQGKHVSLSVDAQSDENFKLDYQWYKDNKLIPNAVSQILNFESISYENSGTYFCSIKSEKSEETIDSRPAALYVVTSTSITKQPNDIKLDKNYEDSIVVLSFDAHINGVTIEKAKSANEYVKINWFIITDKGNVLLNDDETYTGSKSNNLSIKLENIKDTSYYFAVIEGKCGIDTTRIVSVIKNSKDLMISVQIEDLDVCEGNVYSIKATTTTNLKKSKIEYHWYKDDLPLYNKSNLKGIFSDELVFNPILVEDKGKYKLEAQIKDSNIVCLSNIITVKVNRKPEIVCIRIDTMSLTILNQASVSVFYKDNTDSIYIELFKDEKIIKTYRPYSNNYEWVHNGIFDLNKIINQDDLHSKYWAIASNKCGISYSDTVTIENDRNNFSKCDPWHQRQEYCVNDNDSAFFQLDLKQFPSNTLFFKWWFHTTLDFFWNYYPQYNTSYVTLKPFIKRGQDQFDLVFYKPLTDFLILSPAFNLTIRSKPNIATQPKNKTVSLGKNEIIFTIGVENDPLDKIIGTIYYMPNLGATPKIITSMILNQLEDLKYEKEVTESDEGYYYAELTSSYCGTTISDTVSVTVVPSGSISNIENNITENKYFTISPNPAIDYIYISPFNPTLKRGVDEVSNIQIIDMLGINVSTAGGGIKKDGKIDISNLAPGMYFIKIGNRVEKFVKM